jgi:hypothetical protein
MATAGYIVGVVFASLAAFAIYVADKFLIPVWAIPANELSTYYSGLVGGSPTYVNGFDTIVVNENLLIQGAFIMMMLGVIFVFVIFYAWRHVYTSTALGGEEPY